MSAFDGMWAAISSSGVIHAVGTRGTPGPGPISKCGSGSRRRPYGGASTCGATATATCGRGGATLAPSRAVVTGSHLDSVPARRGVRRTARRRVRASPPSTCCALGGFDAGPPVGVVCFTDEEGARFGVPCLGSRLLTGALDPDRPAGSRDADGDTLADAMHRGRARPGSLGPRRGALRRIGVFVELHVEQGRALVHLDAPVGVGSAIWPHGRWRLDFHGRGRPRGHDAAGGPRRPDAPARRAPCSPRARPRARLGARGHRGEGPGLRPAAPTRCPAACAAWLDARGPRRGVPRRARRRRSAPRAAAAAEHGTTVAVRAGVGRRRTVALRPRACGTRLARASLRRTAPVLPTGAGHDAGSWRRSVPDRDAVRSQPDGVSHSPAEHAERGRLPKRRRRPRRPCWRSCVPVTRYWCELAWLPRGRRRRACSSRSTGPRSPVVPGRRAARRTPCGCPASTLPGPGQRATRTPSTARCAGARRRAQAARSGPGASRCTRVAEALDPDATWRWPGPPTRRWRWPGSPRGRVPLPAPRAGRRPYDDPNAMGHALVAGRRGEAGLRITLLDTCYLTGGIGTAARAAPQLRFGDGDADGGRQRAEALAGAGTRGERRRGDRRGRPLGARGAARADAGDRRVLPPARRAAARARLRAAGGERRVRGDVRGQPGAGAARARRARPALHRRARHPPDRRRHRAARPVGHARLHVPHHRTRPRRRHRPRQGAVRRTARRSHSAPTAMRSSTCSRRPARWSWTNGWPPATRPLARRRAPDAATGAGHASLGFPDAGLLVPGALGRPGLGTPRLGPYGGRTRRGCRGGGVRGDGGRRALGRLGRPARRGGRPARAGRRGRHC